ncbi:MAG: galactokinase family protein, partial [Corynebacterium casei]
MPMWPAPTSPASTRAHQAHSAHAGAPAQAVASAPGTWSIAGEHADHFGGIVVMGISELRAAAAVSPRNDGTIKVRFIEHTHEGGKQTDDSITLDELQERFIQQQPQIDEQGRTVIPPAPEGSLASRIGGVIWTMI